MTKESQHGLDGSSDETSEKRPSEKRPYEKPAIVEELPYTTYAMAGCTFKDVFCDLNDGIYKQS